MKTKRRSLGSGQRGQGKPLTYTFSPELSRLIRERMSLTGLDEETYIAAPVEAFLENSARSECQWIISDTVAEAEALRDRIAVAENCPAFGKANVVPSGACFMIEEV